MRKRTRAAPEGHHDLVPHLPQKRQARLSVMHVPRPVLHAQDVRGLGDMRQDRVVARHLAVMRIEAAKRALHLQPCRDHHAIHVDGDRPQPERGQHARDDAGIGILQPANGCHQDAIAGGMLTLLQYATPAIGMHNEGHS